jgi:para-nitrobenzyl esterase
VQIFDTRPTIAPYPEEASRLIWQDHAFAALTLAGP